MPAVGPSWEDAAAFCAWTGEREGFAVRLPTEAEWECAARAGRDVLYPWGDEPPESLPDYAARWLGGPEPVDAYPSLHPLGFLGLGENVHEWCADWYDPRYYEVSPARRPPRAGRRHPALVARRLLAPPDQGEPLRRPLGDPAGACATPTTASASPRSKETLMLRPSRRAAAGRPDRAASCSTPLVALSVWQTWGSFGRGNVLAWIDFPVSLAFLHLDGTPLPALEPVAGGLQWAVIAALLSLWLGRRCGGGRARRMRKGP